MGTLNPNTNTQSEYPECLMGSMVTPGEYWLINKCPTHTAKVQQLEEELSQLLNKNTTVPNPDDIDTNDFVAVECPPEDGFWKRGRAVSRIGRGVFKVFLVDSGQVIQITVKRMRIPLEPRFLKVEPLAFKYCLYGTIPCIKEFGGRKKVTLIWTDEARFFVNNLFSKKHFFHIKIAHIIGRTLLGDIYLFNKHSRQFYSLSRLLCAKNLAIYSEPYYKEKVMTLEHSLVDNRYLTPDSEVSIHIDAKLKRMEELRLVNMQRESDGHVPGKQGNGSSGSESDETEEVEESALCDNSSQLIQNLLQNLSNRPKLRCETASNFPEAGSSMSSDFQNQELEREVVAGSSMSSDFQNQELEREVVAGSHDEEPPLESVNGQPDPAPLMEIQVPKPAVEKSGPRPLMEINVPMPVIEKQSPRPLMEIEIPIPVIEKPSPRPLMEVEIPMPVVEKQAPKPLTVMEFPQLSVGLEIPKPLDGIEFRKPLMGIESTKPSMGIEIPKSCGGIEFQKPLEGIEFQKPLEGIEFLKPLEDIEGLKPLEEIEISEPLEEIEIPKPSVEIEIPRPSVGIEIPKSCEGIEFLKPLEDIEGLKPLEEIEISKPLEEIEIPKPCGGIEFQKPLEGIEFQKPLEGIEFLKPLEDIEGLKPLEEIEISEPLEEIEIPKPSVEIEIPRPSVGIEIPKSCEGIEFLKPLEDIEGLKPLEEMEISKPLEEIEIPKPSVEIEIPRPSVGIEIPKSCEGIEFLRPLAEMESPKAMMEKQIPDSFMESETSNSLTEKQNTDPFPEFQISRRFTERHIPKSFMGSRTPKPLMEVDIPKPAMKDKFLKFRNQNNFSHTAGMKEHTDGNKKNRQGFKIYFDEKYSLPNLEVVGSYEVFHVFYDNVLEPLDHFKNLNISRILFRNIARQVMFERPTPIQRWAIPSIVNGDDLVILGEPRTGKTLSFILGVLEVFKLKMEVGQFQLGKGPLALILSSSSRTCEFIYSVFNQLTNKKDRKVRVPLCKLNIRFVNNSLVERHSMPYLVNRCDLVISTPQCFLRVLNNRDVTDFTKLNMVVYDGADLCAAEPFLSEMKLLLNQTKMPKNVQKIFCGERWTYDFEVLTTTFLREHSAVIGSYLEAAMYANVQPNVYFIDVWEKDRTLIDLTLQKYKGRKIVIVCNKTEEIFHVEGLFRGQNKTCSVAHSESPSDVLKNIKYNWGRSKDWCVVVCTQNIIEALGIYNADVLINYSLSTDRELCFGDRFSLITNKMKDYIFKRRARPTVDFLFDDKTYFRLPELLDFFQRRGVQIPPRLKDVVDAEVQARERELLLCENVLKYGHCKELWRCNGRHNFIKVVDFPATPLCGIIKFVVLKVHSTTHLSVRILELSDQLNNYKRVVFPDLTLQVTRQLRNLFREKHKRIPLTSVKVNTLCVVNRNDASGMRFHRARIIEVKKYVRLHDPVEVTVKLIDWGCVLRVNVSKLFELPEELKVYPPLATDLYLCNLVPKDFERDWSDRDIAFAKTMFMMELEGNQVWIGRIKLSLESAVFVDPVKLCYTLENEKSYVIEFSAPQRLRYSGIADEKPQHLKSLYSLCEKANIDTSIYEYNLEASENTCQPDCAHFDADFVEILFIHGRSPTSLFVRNRKFDELLTSLENECEVLGCRQQGSENYNLNNPMLRKKLSVGMCCMALNGNIWNRAKILSFEKDRVKVFFLDYGDTDYVRDVVPIPETLLLKLPAQAIECYLVGVDPKIKVTDAVMEEIYDFVRNNEGNLSVSVIEKVMKSRVTGGWKYGVNVLNPLGKSLNKLLIDLRLVQPTSNYLDIAVDMDMTSRIDDPDETDAETYDDEDTDEERNRDETDLSRFDTLSIVDSDSGNDLNKAPTTPEEGDDLTHFLRIEPVVFNDENACCMLEEFLCNLAPEQVTRREPQSKAETDKKEDEPVTENNKVVVQEEKRDGANEAIPQEAVAAPAEVVQNDVQLEPAVVKARLNYLENRRRSVNRNLPYMRYFPDMTIANISKNLVPTGVLTPEILWSQTHTEVEVKILLTNVATYKFDCTVENFIFRCLLTKKPYVSTVRLFGAVNPEMTRVEVKTFFVVIVFQKLCPLIWPRLCRENKKFRWIKYNIEHFKEKKSTISEILCSQAMERIKSGNLIVPKVTEEIKFVPSSSSESSDWSDSEGEEFQDLSSQDLPSYHGDDLEFLDFGDFRKRFWGVLSRAAPMQV